MLREDADLMEEPCPALKQHLYKQLWTCCPRTLQKSCLPAPLLSLPGEFGSVQCTCTHWAIPSSIIHWVAAAQLSCPWNPGTDNMQPGQHRAWACRDMHTAVVLYLCLSIHTERAKRGEKKPEISVRGRSEAMNSTYVTISKDTNLRFCWVFALGNAPPSDLFKKWCCEG